jgi:hypothetical protein
LPDSDSKHLQRYKDYTIWIHPSGTEGAVFGPRWSSVMPLSARDGTALMARGREVIDALREGAAAISIPLT